MGISGPRGCLARGRTMPPGPTDMVLRKLLLFSTILGVTLPKEITNAARLEKGQYVEVYLRDNKTIVIKRHGTEPKLITTAD